MSAWRSLRTRGAGLCLALTAAAGAWGCGSGDSDLRKLGPEGEACYRLVPNDASGRLGLPWGFVLSGAPLRQVEGDDRLLAHTLAEDGGRAEYPVGYWRWVAGDSVQVGSSNMGPFQLILGGDAGALSGRGRSTGDALRPGRRSPPGEVAGIEAVRVECAALP